ncbi:hemerythrin domain-containing protein [Pseudobdellovibrio sp. HCB154]|uniref:hemerythrin domain-containing protein n=1 Tax=Pseudobdellovibrio sp. HCB154 TaxID=3386277 RepID=UPI0039171ACE
MTNKPTLGRDFDRDKNLTYRPQDESGDLPYHPLVMIDTKQQESIVSLILEQHRMLYEFTKTLKDSKSNEAAKQKALFDLVGLWVPHAQAEENALYDEIIFSKEVQHQLDEAIEEHAIMQIMIEELEGLNFRLTWNKNIEQKAKALADVIDRHVLVEEESYLKLVQDLIPPENLQLLGREFTRQFEAVASHYKASLKPSRILS